MSSSTTDRPRKSRARRAARRVKRRPAEAAGAGGSLVGLITAISLGDGLAAATAAVGMVPAIWTFWKVNGGWRGIKEEIEFGDGPYPPSARGRVDGAEAA